MEENKNARWYVDEPVAPVPYLQKRKTHPLQMQEKQEIYVLGGKISGDKNG